MSNECLQVVLDGYATLLQEKGLAVSKHLPRFGGAAKECARTETLFCLDNAASVHYVQHSQGCVERQGKTGCLALVPLSAKA